jgi:flagellar operon protein
VSAVLTNPALIPPAGAGVGAPTAAPAPANAPRRSLGGSSAIPSTGRTVAADPSTSSGPAFAEVLQKAGGSEPLHFSRHALERVQRRGIPLDTNTLSRLQEGVGRAAGKGSRDSVVLVDGTAFVVAVGSRTVVTAVGAEHMHEQVFTNIDSAVIA